MESLTLRPHQIIHAPVQTAYDAFVKPHQPSRWFMRSATADRKIGGRYGNADGDRGEFLLLQRPRSLSFTWENAGHGPRTVVSITFSPLPGEAIEISLEHSGLASPADQDEMHTGWSWGLDSLKSYRETGKAIPYDEWAKNPGNGR